MFKSFMQSMTGRVFLILFGGIVVSTGLTMLVAAYESKDMVAQVRARHAQERIEQIILTLDATPPAARAKIADISEKSGIRVDFSQPTTVIGNVVDPEMTNALTQALGENRKIIAFSREGDDCPVYVHLPRAGTIVGSRRCHIVLATLLDGTAMRVDIAIPNRMPPPFRAEFLPFLLIFLVCVALLAFLVAHITTKPVRRLAQAAHDLGGNIEQAPLPETEGPIEVRDAAAAFNSMQTRIRHYIQERTYMLAAIAHDLQTPLTRLRLRLEKVADDELRDKLVSDLTVTQDMIREGLELARSLNAEEPFELLDIDSLIDTICNDATDAGLEVTQSGKVNAPLMARPNTLKRCLSNLIDNAIKYGSFAHVGIKKEGLKVVISVIDGGPGIPDNQLETVFQPFNRLDNSRSRGSGGTGLGLTIARNIAEKHGGTLILRNIRAGGLGLEATLTLMIS